MVCQRISRSIPEYSWITLFLMLIIFDHGTFGYSSLKSSGMFLAASPSISIFLTTASIVFWSLEKSSLDKFFVYAFILSTEVEMSSRYTRYVFLDIDYFPQHIIFNCWFKSILRNQIYFFAQKLTQVILKFNKLKQPNRS